MIKTGYICVEKTRVFLHRWSEAKLPYVYAGVARPTCASQFVNRFDEHKAALLEEWNAGLDDDSWSHLLKDVSSARRAAAYYCQHGKQPEVIAVTECLSQHDVDQRLPNGEFLGFDVALLTLESRLYPRPWYDYEVPYPHKTWVPIWRLEAAFVGNHLNENGLIDSFHAAEIIRDSVNSMAVIEEKHDSASINNQYRVLAINLVTE